MSETSNAILEAKRRARDYWDIDGLPALLIGANTVLLGVLWLPKDRLRSWWGAALVLGLFALFLLSESKKILEWLKGRITYPRTGYVAPPKEPIVGRAGTKAIELTDIPFFLFLALLFADNNWLVSLNGWLITLACMATAILFWWNDKKNPPWFEIAGAAIAGFVNALLQVSGEKRVGIFLLVFGAAGMVKGATLLIRYLRQHPAPQA